jgi:hypothetical protein
LIGFDRATFWPTYVGQTWDYQNEQVWDKAETLWQGARIAAD